MNSLYCQNIFSSCVVLMTGWCKYLPPNSEKITMSFLPAAMLPTRESNFLCMWVLTEIQQQQKILQVTWEKKVKLFYLIVIKDEWIWIDLQISVTSPPFSLTAPDFFFFFFSEVSPSVLSGQDNNLWVNEFESWDQLSVKYGWEK